jgi:SAM-dependent methyltransferase
MSLLAQREYWDDHFRSTGAYVFYDAAEYRRIVELLGVEALRGRPVLEIGSGAGVWTANLARLGARVVHFDLTAGLVRMAARAASPAETAGLVADMQRLPFADRTFDAVFGSMVVHHSPDHAALGREVARVLRPGGRAIFHENSAANPILMLARATLVGRMGIPKYSSPGEHPLEAGEIEAFGAAFRSHQVVYGRLVLAQLGVKYLFKRETGALFAAARGFDNRLFRICRACRRLSYYQILSCRV